jgi:hypothetical protein
MRHAGIWLNLLLLMTCVTAHAQTPPLPGQAQAAAGGLNSTSAPNQAATINLAEGDARIVAPGARARAARVGDVVNEGDVLVTGKDGEMHLTMQDTGFIALRPDTRMRIASYKADGGDDDKAIFRLLAGGFRSVTGWIGKFNPRAYRVQTPTATIGIRGTDHEPRYIPEGSSDGPAGTYDKVYVGSTEIENPSGKAAVAPAQAGFVPQNGRERPRVLARVPGFFHPSRYEPMIEKKHAEIQKMIEQRREERRKVVAEKRAALEAARTQTKALLEQNKAAAENMRKAEAQRQSDARQKRAAAQESGKAAAELRKDVQEKRKTLQEDETSGQTKGKALREERKALRDENKAAQEKLRDAQEKRKALQEETKAAAEARKQANEERKKKTQQQIEELKDKRKDLHDEREDMQKELKSLREQEQQRYREELKAARKKQPAETGGPTSDKTPP